MSDKQAVLDMVNRLPENLTLEQIRDEIDLLASLREGYTDSQAGRVVPHDEVKRRFAKWLSA